MALKVFKNVYESSFSFHIAWGLLNNNGKDGWKQRWSWRHETRLDMQRVAAGD